MGKISSWKFGDTPKESDLLLELVINGEKTATSSLYDSYVLKKVKLPKVGDKSQILDSRDKKRCLIKIVKVEVKQLGEVDEEFACKEGEGDRTLKYWRKVHKKFFMKRLMKMNKKFSDKILVVCEEFKVLKVFD